MICRSNNIKIKFFLSERFATLFVASLALYIEMSINFTTHKSVDETIRNFKLKTLDILISEKNNCIKSLESKLLRLENIRSVKVYPKIIHRKVYNIQHMCLCYYHTYFTETFMSTSKNILWIKSDYNRHWLRNRQHRFQNRNSILNLIVSLTQ